MLPSGAANLFSGTNMVSQAMHHDDYKVDVAKVALGALCSQMDTLPHSWYWLYWCLCSQMDTLTHSLHWLCWHVPVCSYGHATTFLAFCVPALVFKCPAVLPHSWHLLLLLLCSHMSAQPHSESSSLHCAHLLLLFSRSMSHCILYSGPSCAHGHTALRAY